MSMGDFAPGVTVPKKFTTIDSTGAPTTLSGTPAISIYKDSSTTQSTSGVTLSVDFDSVTGLNNVAIDTSADGTFYSAGSSFQIVITTGTVDSVSVVGYVVGEFTLGRSAAYARLGAPAGASIAADIATVDSNVDAILVDTGTTLDGKINTIDSNVDAILVDTGTTLQGELDAIEAAVITNAAGTDIAADIIALKTVADAILVDTGTTLDGRIPAALTGDGNMKVDVLAISGDTGAADKLEEGATALVTSTCAASSTTTTIETNLTEATNDHYNGRVITFTSGALLGQSTDITDYNGTTKALTVTALTEGPAENDAFVIS